MLQLLRRLPTKDAMQLRVQFDIVAILASTLLLDFKSKQYNDGLHAMLAPMSGDWQEVQSRPLGRRLHSAARVDYAVLLLWRYHPAIYPC